MKIFSSNFIEKVEKLKKQFKEKKNSEINAINVEIHALSSATKPLCAWISRDAVQDCRESCGGHGYLKGIRFLTILTLIVENQ